MRLSLDPQQGYVIRRYEVGELLINDISVASSVLLTPTRLQPWSPTDFDALQPAHFAALLELEPELVVFGSGARQRFPPPQLTRPLIEAGVGVESMDTAAACRTYNILMSEGRGVVAALLMIEANA